MERKSKAAAVIAKAAGMNGMIAGQVIDLESEGKQVDNEILNRMHRLKTGALIKAPVVSAAILCGADADDIQKLDEFAENLGLAFQIKDDILDVEAAVRNLAKRLAAMPIITNPHMLPFTVWKNQRKYFPMSRKRPLMPLKSSGKKRIF